MFDGQLRALAGQVRLVVPDLRGFGLSATGEGPTTMETLAEDALALLDHLRIEAAVVGGVSMGGYAAFQLLRRDPGRVRGLVLADTQVGADDEAGRLGRETLAQEVLGAGMDVLVQRQLPRLLAPAAAPDVQAQVEQLMRANSPQGAAAALRGMALRGDSRDILARFAGPVLVVVGAQDVLTPPEKARAMASLVATSTFVEIPGAGHLANLEAPAAFNDALKRFLQAAHVD
jgi:pimeloyl-ACP methyl ester carboxylesterase